MSNCLDKFVSALIANCLGEDQIRHTAFEGPPIVKRHTGDRRLSTVGDLSFPVAAQRWNVLLKDDQKRALPDDTIFQVTHPDVADTEEYIRQMTINMQTSVQHIRLAEERVLIFLNRPFVFATLIEILGQGTDYGKERKTTECVSVVRGVAFGLAEESQRTITEYRCQLIEDVLHNLIGYSRYQLVDKESSDDNALVKLSVSFKSCVKNNDDPHTNVLCGVVRDGNGQHKMSFMTTAEYIRWMKQWNRRV